MVQANQNGQKLNGTHRFWCKLLRIYWVKTHTLYKNNRCFISG